jgi:hypothetical protein
VKSSVSPVPQKHENRNNQNPIQYQRGQQMAQITTPKYQRTLTKATYVPRPTQQPRIRPAPQSWTQPRTPATTQTPTKSWSTPIQQRAQQQPYFQPVQSTPRPWSQQQTSLTMINKTNSQASSLEPELNQRQYQPQNQNQPTYEKSQYPPQNREENLKFVYEEGQMNPELQTLRKFIQFLRIIRKTIRFRCSRNIFN